MKSWTVLSSSNFDDSRSSYRAYFKFKLVEYNAEPDGEAARQLQEHIHGFLQFCAKLEKFEAQDDDSLLPADELAYIQHDPDGVPIYSLFTENWRCLYLVSEDESTCIAIKIEDMSDTLRYVEEDRHRTKRLLLRST